MIVLPMAGLSSRFFRAGYTRPKYMLELHGKTVFAHSLHSFKAFFGKEPILIICRDNFSTPEFVREECAKAGLNRGDMRLVVLDYATTGQAETVAVGLERVGATPDEPLTIFNIDTFRPGFTHPEVFDLEVVDGYLEVVQATGSHWSFVLPDISDPASFRAAEVQEKVRISDLCSTGLYYFRNVALFQNLYKATAIQALASLQGGERYIAPLYNDAIRLGADIRYALIAPSDVLFCGTPDEYSALRVLKSL